jgi:hypothetical protein
VESPSIIPLAFAVVALVAGVGLLLVRINPEHLAGSSHSMPGLALFRFRAFRYGAAFACLVAAAVGAAAWAGFV